MLDAAQRGLDVGYFVYLCRRSQFEMLMGVIQHFPVSWHP